MGEKAVLRCLPAGHVFRPSRTCCSIIHLLFKQQKRVQDSINLARIPEVHGKCFSAANSYFIYPNAHLASSLQKHSCAHARAYACARLDVRRLRQGGRGLQHQHPEAGTAAPLLWATRACPHVHVHVHGQRGLAQGVCSAAA